MAKIVMQAPKGVTQAVIEGHQYDIPKDGKIKVVSDSHLEVLIQHGFTHTADADLSPEELAAWIEETDDKEQLINFIEERGGEADEDMSFKKLKRLAREAVAAATEE